MIEDPVLAAALTELARVERRLAQARASGRHAAERQKFVADLLAEHEGDAAAARQLVEKCARELRTREREIRELSDVVTRLRMREKSVGSGRELAAVQGELAAKVAELDRAEEGGLALIEALEAAQGESKRLAEELARQRDKIERERQELADSAPALAARERVLATEVDDCDGRLPARVAAVIHQVRAHLELPVVSLAGSACGGCHAQLPKQEAITIGHGGVVERCQFCGRYLVPEE